MDKSVEDSKHKKKIGALGENMACRFLMKRSFNVLDRNYSKKWGEIDIVAEKDKVLHFIEVKSVVSCATDKYRPEENVHYQKLKRLSRVIQTYLLDKNVSYETEWQIDVIAVFLDLESKKAKFRFTENIII
jgi:putative endonuclease